MYRIDHCENLIHFTKGSDKSLDYEKAYENLKKIVSEQTIVGSTGMILGKLKCVCFTESPVRCLTNSGQLDTHYFSRYTPFGIQLPKKTVFNFGGRPAIYSLRSEYEHIKQIDEVNWRYVSYDPNLDGDLDFTWEREWRIRTDNIIIDPNEAKLVFPNIDWINRFIDEHERDFHGVDIDDDCEECYCTREATILNFTDFLQEGQCEYLTGTCPDPSKFPWILINMNEVTK
ncbi:MAG TPA: hypothetical protein VI603_10525 [Saprospiraceae bacterium]|nr:hypothetical protein [Saprospiraceae bacterium]